MSFYKDKDLGTYIDRGGNDGEERAAKEMGNSVCRK